MSSLSLHAIDQLYKSDSEDPALLLLTLNFPNATNFYFVNNTENITSNSQEFTAFPFSFTLPSDTSDSVPELTITLDNIGLELIDDFRTNTDSIKCRVDLIFASNPDFLEVTINELIVKSISYNKQFITISVGYDDILNTSIPSSTYNPINFPGIFGV